MKVRFSPEAQSDLLEIAAFVAEESPHAARKLASELRAKVADLATMSQRFFVVGRRGEAVVRRRVHGSYAIYYTASTDRVVVIRILHSARDVDRLLFPED